MIVEATARTRSSIRANPDPDYGWGSRSSMMSRRRRSRMARPKTALSMAAVECGAGGWFVVGEGSGPHQAIPESDAVPSDEKVPEVAVRARPFVMADSRTGRVENALTTTA